MDVSYIFSADELFTLISLIPDRSDAGQRFCEDALADAALCSLDGLGAKKMAKQHPGNQLELAPVIRMITETLAKAESLERIKNGWLLRSPWITVSCEAYPHLERHYLITPLEEAASET